jgi:hypothetical protein
VELPAPSSSAPSLFKERREFIYRILHATPMAGDSTSVRVSRTTLSELERFQGALQTRTADETIRFLLLSKRKELIARMYGNARGKHAYRPFEESDRLEIDR